MNFDINCTKEPILSFDELPFKKVASGKVREIFDLGDAYLMVASDRISAFDVVFDEGLYGKGILLTAISLIWFEKISSMISNHLVDDHETKCNDLSKQYPFLSGRIMIVKKLKPLSIEAIVRGYLSGSAWIDYKKNKSVLGYNLPNNLFESSKLDFPIFTPTTKAQSGHDIPISINKASELIGEDNLKHIQKTSIEVFNFASNIVKRCGLILADTKFEFGLDDYGNIFLIDEVLTPDSSRYWFKKTYKVGQKQDPLDKQYIRDYLNTTKWNKRPPAPSLPKSVLSNTLDRYLKAYELISSVS